MDPIGPLSNFPNGFANGLMVRGMPLLQMQPGVVWWVNNSTILRPQGRAGSDSNRGTFLSPFATINFAVNTAATASRGDIVFVGPGHAETISDAVTLSLANAGVAVIGLGSGSLRPTLTFGAAAGNIPLLAANCSMQNILFKANFAAIVSAFTATSTNTPTDFELANCEFRDGSSSLNFISLVTGNATANSMDGFRFVGNKKYGLGTTAATTAIKMLAAFDRVQLLGNWGVDAILNDTAALLAAGSSSGTNFELTGNRWFRPNTSSTGGSFISGTGTAWSGIASDNRFWQLDNSAGIWISTGTKLGFFENYSPITGAADASGLINPAAA